MTATELGKQLALRAEEVARLLIPGGRRAGAEWHAGSISGEKGKSLKIVLSGPKAGMWMDFAGHASDKGDLIGLWKVCRGLTLAEACAQAEEFLGVTPSNPAPVAPRLPTSPPSEQWADIQARMRVGTPEDLDALAALRGIPSVGGLELASKAGQLFFCDIWEDGAWCPCWILTDATRINAQARKMSGEMWTSLGNMKCKTVAGCRASWPVGLHGINGADIAFCEGSPDHLAAWHYIWRGGYAGRIAPVSMFGASMSIPEECVPLFSGKRVFAFAHSDEAGAQAVSKWEKQAGVPFVRVSLDGKKDLNELVAAQPEPAEGIFSAPVQIPEWQARRIRSAAKPGEPVTRLFLAGKPVATPGNLVTLISKAKTGKTATIGAIVAAIIAAHYDRKDLDTFGFTAPHTDEAVVLIDTEQSPFDAYTCHQRAMARAAQEGDPDWLFHYALVGYDHAKLKTTLEPILASAHKSCGGIFTLILDGVADFVASVNDEAECNTFISELRALAVKYDCAVICVIHSNEGIKTGDDGRGHLGKQLTRKAESNLLLKKVDEITVITSEKQRKAPITEADGIAFRWSDEHGRHIRMSGPSISRSKAGRPVKYDPQDMLTCFPTKEQPGMTVAQVYRLVQALPCGISDRGFKDVVAKFVQTGEVERLPGGALGHLFRRAF